MSKQRKITLDKKHKRIIASLLISGSFNNPVVHKTYIKTSRRLDKAIKNNPRISCVLEFEINKLTKIAENLIFC